MFGFIKKLFGSNKTLLQEALQKGAVIIDVRTPVEYQAGHISGSRNIPLNTIKNRVNELKKTGKPVITVCRSGNRSGMASGILKQSGIDAINGGPWTSLKNIM